MKKVLIVEDDELLLNLLMTKFKDGGYEPISAKNGVEGLKKYTEEKPDVVIADIIMPEKNGIDMLKEIRAQDPSVVIPFIFLTNDNDMDVMAEAIAHKATAYLVKSNQQIENIVSLVEKKIGK